MKTEKVTSLQFIKQDSISCRSWISVISTRQHSLHSTVCQTRARFPVQHPPRLQFSSLVVKLQRYLKSEQTEQSFQSSSPEQIPTLCPSILTTKTTHKKPKPEMQLNQTAFLILFSFQHSSQQLWLLPLDWALSSWLFCLHINVIQFSQMQQQLLQVVSCQRRQRDDPLSYLLPKEWQIDPGLSKVNLIPNHNTGPLRQAFFICFQFIFQVLQLNPRLRHREIHHVQEEAAALNVL